MKRQRIPVCHLLSPQYPYLQLSPAQHLFSSISWHRLCNLHRQAFSCHERLGVSAAQHNIKRQLITTETTLYAKHLSIMQGWVGGVGQWGDVE